MYGWGGNCVVGNTVPPKLAACVGDVFIPFSTASALRPGKYKVLVSTVDTALQTISQSCLNASYGKIKLKFLTFN